jgi:hypothetical protein
MPAFLPKTQKIAHRLIRLWGGNQKGQIIRDGVTRAEAYMARMDYTPKEQGLFLEGSERMAVSSLGQTEEIDFEQDKLIFAGKQYRIVSPVKGPRPSGLIIFFDCNVVFDQSV